MSAAICSSDSASLTIPLVGGPATEADLGRFALTGKAEDRSVFRVPSLRNVAETAPYFHDGRAATLEQAVAEMARVQLGRTLASRGSRPHRPVPAHAQRRVSARARSGGRPAMTGAAARMGLVLFGLLLVLTYLLLRGFTPDAALHEQRLHAIDALTFNEAALHRDVLKASHGLLLDYDPLVATVARLREVSAELDNAGAPRPLMDGIAAELDRQEALVEEFKSAHALLRNSLAYFAYLSEQLVVPGSEPGQAVAMVVGRLASAMFRFVGSASNAAAAAEVAAALDELSVQAVPADLRDDTDALRAHGALILKNQPLVGRDSRAPARDAGLRAGAQPAGSLHGAAARCRVACLDLSCAALPRLGPAAGLSRPSLWAAARQGPRAQGTIGFRAPDRRHIRRS